MRLLVVGAGATGGYFGGRLAQAGRDVTFLVRPERGSMLRERGLQIISPNGDAIIRPQLVTASDLNAPFDAILVAVKAYALEPAMNDFAAAVGPQTIILPVLNGMKHMQLLSGRFGSDAVVGCVCHIVAQLDADGRIKHLAPLPLSIAYGEMDGSISPRLEALNGFMQGAGFEARLSPTIAREMWEKWILLASLGGITCLMRGSVGAIVAAPGGTDFILRFFEEVVAIANAAGVAPSGEFLAAAKRMLTTAGSNATSSMYRDLENGNRIEADQIMGDLLARARGRRGLNTPLVEAAYAHLCVYQNRPK